MRLHGTVEVHVRGEPVVRDPGVWDKLKRAFGGTPDLSTNRVRATLEAAAVVEGAQVALRGLGITNAISLVIDDQVVFEDRRGRGDDLGDLLIAFHDQAGVFGGGFSLLRLAAEHEEAGLHLVVEAVARTEHPADEPAMRVVLAGRVRALEPLPDESPEAYRTRVAPLASDGALVKVHRAQFESFADRVAHAFRRAMPWARVEVRWAEARVERPARRAADRPRPPKALPPTSPQYDPYVRWYPSPLDGMANAVMWGFLFSTAMTPDLVVVDHDGSPVGHASDFAESSGAGGDWGEQGGDGGDAGDAGDGGDGGFDQGGDAGDFDGGDFDGGGFDGGGFDGF